MNTDPQTDPRVKNLRDAQRRLRSALIANADRLDKPFTDDPDKNPWDTFVRPAMRELKAAVDAIASAPAAPVAAPPTGQAAAEPVNPCTRGATFCGQHGYDCPPLAGQAGLRDRIAKAVDEGFRLHAELEDSSLGGSITDSVLTAMLAALSADSEPHRLALSTTLGLGTSAPWDAIRERAAGLQAEVVSLTEASRRLLEQRQEMAEERYAWQERGDRAEERVRALEAGQAALSDTDRKFLAFALDLAADQMASRGDEFGPDDEDAMERLRRLAAETPGPETQPVQHAPGSAILCPDCRAKGHSICMADEEQQPVKPTSHAWTFEVCYKGDKWHGCGATYDSSVFGNAHETARDDFQHRAENDKQRRRFRMIRATTTYAIEAEHTPDTVPAVVAEPGKEAL